MAHRGFFGYEPYVDQVLDLYDYHAAAALPYDFSYQRQPAPTRARSSRGGIFAGADPRERETKTSFSVPIHGPDSDPEPEPEPEPERKRERRTAPAAMSSAEEEAAVRVQAAARGLLARKSVRAVREVEREAGQLLADIASEAGARALLADLRARAAVVEALMRMLLRLDAVRGARVYRRRITKRVLALQDHVDALETTTVPVGEEADADDTPEATSVETMVEESAVAPEMPDAAERGAAGEPEAEAGEEKEAVARDDADVDVVDDEAEDSDAEGDWEMVTEENDEHAGPVASATPDDQEPPRKEPPACPFETSSPAPASAGAAVSDGVDVTKVMQMVAALCEQSAQQCALIGALAQRVDVLEHTVRRMAEDAQKLSTEAREATMELF